MTKLVDKRYPVTSFFLIVTALVFFLMLVVGGAGFTSAPVLYQFGAVYGLAIQVMPEQLWRLVAAIFVHIGWEHVIVNMVSLYFLGRQAESIFGSKQFFFLYLLSGVMGNIFVFCFSPDALTAGASTSLYGLFAAMIVLRFASRNPYIQQLGQAYTSLFIINLIGSILMPGVSLAGHIGGAVGGAFLAIVFPVRGERKLYPLLHRLLSFLVFLLLAGFLLYSGFM